MVGGVKDSTHRVKRKRILNSHASLSSPPEAEEIPHRHTHLGPLDLLAKKICVKIISVPWSQDPPLGPICERSHGGWLIYMISIFEGTFLRVRLFYILIN